jgi:hypothetical protein
VSDAEIQTEIIDDHEQFALGGVRAAAHQRTARVSLAVRHWIMQEKLNARLQLQLQKYIWPDKACGV